MLLIFYCTYLLEVSRNRVREDVALDFKEEGICFLFSYKSVFHGFFRHAFQRYRRALKLLG